jgi:hypothetical protein
MMNHGTRIIRKPRGAWPPATRTAAAVIAAAGLALLPATYSDSRSSTGASGFAYAAGSTNVQKLLAFSRCMRSHGVRSWPDPTRYAPHPERPFFNLSAAGINPNAPQIIPKIHACLYLLHGNNPQRLGGS